MDFTQELIKVFNTIKYRNVSIEKRRGRYYVYGKKVGSLESAKRKVDSSIDSLNKSIKNENQKSYKV